jgi:hypothetical protein
MSIAALAQSVHFKPPHSVPTFSDRGLYLEASGNFSGLGQEQLNVFLDATAEVRATCSNPSQNDGHDQQPAGVNPPDLVVSGVQTISPNNIDKNGNTAYDVLTAAPDPIITGAPGCPGTSWVETIRDLKFTYALITVVQPAIDSTSTTPVIFQACFALSGPAGTPPADYVGSVSATSVALAVCTEHGLSR